MIMQVLPNDRPGHPCHGSSTLGAVQTSFAAKLAELGKSITPVQNNVSKAVNDAVGAVTDPQQQEHIQGRPLEPSKACTCFCARTDLTLATANQIFSNVSSWYTLKRKEWVRLFDFRLEVHQMNRKRQHL